MAVILKPIVVRFSCEGLDLTLSLSPSDLLSHYTRVEMAVHSFIRPSGNDGSVSDKIFSRDSSSLYNVESVSTLDLPLEGGSSSSYTIYLPGLDDIRRNVWPIIRRREFDYDKAFRVFMRIIATLMHVYPEHKIYFEGQQKEITEDQQIIFWG